MTASLSVNADFVASSSKTVAAPFLGITPWPFDFGSVQDGTSSTQTVQLSNNGPASGGNLIISGASVDNPVFAIPSVQFPMTIAPGSAQALSITFTPTASGSAAGTVSFTSNASDPTITLSISGNGSTTATTGTPGFSATPTALFFGNINIGATSTQTLTISNPGTANTVVTAATISGSGLTIVSPAFPLTLTPGTSQVVTISFSPQNAGSVTGVVTFTSNAPASPVISVVASANGSSPTTSVTPVPSIVNFGSTPLGSTYQQSIVLYNTGNTSVTVNNAFVIGAGFAVSTAGFPITIPVYGSQAFTLSFTPPAAGTSTGTLSFSTNAPDPQPTATLTGTGVFISQHRATLSWSASPSQIIGYNVYRSITSGSGYQLVSFVSATSFVDSAVTSGQTYYWVVTAVNASGTESTYSNQVSATIPLP
jgi:hypothetical protein